MSAKEVTVSVRGARTTLKIVRRVEANSLKENGRKRYYSTVAQRCQYLKRRRVVTRWEVIGVVIGDYRSGMFFWSAASGTIAEHQYGGYTKKERGYSASEAAAFGKLCTNRL